MDSITRLLAVLCGRYHFPQRKRFMISLSATLFMFNRIN